MNLSEQAANAAAEAVVKQLDGGFLRLYSSTGQQLVEVKFGSPAFAAAASGAAAANKLEPARVKNSGKAITYRAFTAKGAELLSGPVKEDMQIDDPELQAFGEFVVDGFVYRQGK